MNILGFDTCLEKMYITLMKNGKIVDSRAVETTQSHYHSAFLISTLREIMQENELTPEKFDAIATNIGPGSFTGIRACTTVARVFAQAIGCKVIGVTSLEILSRLNTDTNETLVALDARKGMAYTARYKDKKEVSVPKSMSVEEIKLTINNDFTDKELSVITDAKLCETLGGESYQKSDKDLGEILVTIAKEKIENNDAGGDWRQLHPLYIQQASVTCSNKTK